jgi:hypothetical protein
MTINQYYVIERCDTRLLSKLETWTTTVSIFIYMNPKETTVIEVQVSNPSLKLEHFGFKKILKICMNCESEVFHNIGNGLTSN